MDKAQEQEMAALALQMVESVQILAKDADKVVEVKAWLKEKAGGLTVVPPAD